MKLQNEPMYEIKRLSHRYVNRMRSWTPKCLLFQSSSFNETECLKSIFDRRLHPDPEFLNLKGFTFRFVIPVLDGGLINNMFTRVSNETKESDDVIKLFFYGGIDNETYDPIRKRYGFDIEFVYSHRDFKNREFLWEGNPFGMLLYNVGDQVTGPQNVNFYPELMEYTVLNYFGLNLGYNFYTAPPLGIPAWQAMFAVFQWQVWLPLILAFIIVTLILGTMHSTATYNDASFWLLMTLTGRGKPIKAEDNSTGILMVCWILAAFVISYGFAGALISALTAPTLEKPPNTWQELVDREYVILAPASPDDDDPMHVMTSWVEGSKESYQSVLAEIWNHRVSGDKSYRDFDIRNLDNQYRDDYKDYLSKTRNLALLFWSNDYRFNTFTYNSKGDLKLHAGRMNQLKRNFGHAFRRQFLYIELFRLATRRFWEMGLVYKWENMENKRDPNAEISQKVLDNFENPKRPGIPKPDALTVEHIYGPGIFLLSAFVLWFVVFLVAELKLIHKLFNMIAKKVKEVKEVIVEKMMRRRLKQSQIIQVKSKK